MSSTEERSAQLKTIAVTSASSNNEEHIFATPPPTPSQSKMVPRMPVWCQILDDVMRKALEEREKEQKYD